MLNDIFLLKNIETTMHWIKGAFGSAVQPAFW